MSGRSEYRPDVEGARALAVALVIAFHVGSEVFQGGFIGVDVFFVISGYLVTRLLVAERNQSGRINFLRFYIRRAYRLMPLQLVVITISLFLAIFLVSPIEREQVARSAIAACLYISNILFIRQSTAYFSDSGMQPFLHTWSLSVEEQFYLTWPVLVYCLCWARQKSFKVLIIVALIVIGLGLCEWTTQRNQPMGFFSFFTRYWEFAAGALVALMGEAKFRDHIVTPALITALGLSLVVGSAVAFSGSVNYPGFLTIAPVAGMALLLYGGSGGDRNPVSSVLSSPPLVFIGQRSYGLYLWHWPIILFVNAYLPMETWTGRIAAIASSFVLADLTYRTIENPFRRMGQGQRSVPVLGVSMGVALLACVGLQFFAKSTFAKPPSDIRQQDIFAAKDDPLHDCLAPYTGTEIVRCKFGSVGSATKLVLFGDSHAAQWLDVLKKLSEKNGWELQTYLKSACPVAMLTPFNHFVKRPMPECTEWRQRVVEEIADQKSTMLVMSQHSFGYFNDRENRLDTQLFAKATLETMKRIGTTQPNILMLADTPKMGVDIPICLSRLANQDDERRCSRRVETAAPADIRSAERAWADQVSTTKVLDFTNDLCKEDICWPRIEGIVAFKDENHISIRAASLFADRIEFTLKQMRDKGRDGRM